MELVEQVQEMNTCVHVCVQTKIKAKYSWQQYEGEHMVVCRLVSLVLKAFLAPVFGLLSENEKCEKNHLRDSKLV